MAFSWGKSLSTAVISVYSKKGARRQKTPGSVPFYISPISEEADHLKRTTIPEPRRRLFWSFVMVLGSCVRSQEASTVRTEMCRVARTFMPQPKNNAIAKALSSAPAGPGTTVWKAFTSPAKACP